MTATDPHEREGRDIYEGMCRLDPDEDNPQPWETLSAFDRGYYCTLAEYVIVRYNKRLTESAQTVSVD